MSVLGRVRLPVHEIVLALLLGGVLAGAAWRDPSFVTWGVQLGLSAHAAALMLLALPMTLIIISGGIDLSIGSTMALAAVVMGMTMEAGAPMWASVVAALATGTLAGMVNGVFITRVRVHPLVVTLASLAAYRGLAEGISRARAISGFPEWFQWIGTGAVGGVPVPLMVCVVGVVVAWVVAVRTTPGFRVYAIGGNERAARYAGIPVDRLVFLLYTVSGAVAGLTAVMLTARRDTAKADMGTGMELEVITAVVLGGTSIYGGRGRIIGTVLGVVLIHEVREFVSWHWGSDEVILIVVGGILIGAVLLNNLATRKRARSG